MDMWNKVKKFHPDIAQEAAYQTMLGKPNDECRYFMKIVGKLRNRRFSDFQLPDGDKDIREREESPEFVHHIHTPTPERVAIAREKLRTIPDDMLMLIADHADRDLQWAYECSNGHDFLTNAVYYKTKKGGINRQCRLCKNQRKPVKGDSCASS